MNYEEIGKEAVKHGYDGGGIWYSDTGGNFWRFPRMGILKNNYPDFSYPETEGAALAWIAEKKKFPNCYAVQYHKLWTIIVENEDGSIVSLCVGTSKVEVILAAIKSLKLGKKDNSPMGLNKRLLEVGFRNGQCCWWIDYGSILVTVDGNYIFEERITKYGWVPEGSHPSTIGVATAWLRSFPKIGETLHFWKSAGKWRIASEWPLGEEGYDSELEALVEFAEWAKEEGLLA